MNDIELTGAVESLSDYGSIIKNLENGLLDQPNIQPSLITGSIRGTRSQVGPPRVISGNEAVDQNLHIKKSDQLIPISIGEIERFKLQQQNKLSGNSDQRYPSGDSEITPNGIMQVSMTNKGLDLIIEPDILKEPFKTATVSPVGPKRVSEADKKRIQCSHMYSIDTPILDFLGYDSKGKPYYTDGNSYIERCIYTGYDKSFVSPKIWSPLQGGKKVFLDETYKLSKSGKPVTAKSSNGDITIKGSESGEFLVNGAPPVNDTLTMISKSGYYYTNRPAIKSLFLGYNDSNSVPNKSKYFEKSKDGKKYFYSDRISEHELYADLITPNTISYRKNIGPKFGGKFRNGKEESLYNSNTSNTSDKFRGSYRSLLSSLSKFDIVDIKNETSSNIKRPVLRRRSEQYGPNPLQHLFYMDYYDWRKYTTTYIPSDEKIFNASWKELYCVETLRSDSYDPNIRVFPIDNFFNSGKIGRFEIYPNDVMVDKTRILDIYFGLMEMHIKSFSWDDIFKIVDLIPQFRSDWTDSDWNKLTWIQKNEIRMKELNELESVWEIIEQVLSSTI